MRFIWLILQTGIATDAVFEPQQITYADDPLRIATNLLRCFNISIDPRVDALLDGERPAVYPSEKRLRLFAGGLAGTTVTTPVEVVLTHFIQGVRIENSTRVADNQKLLTAFDLYAAYFTEVSPNARFLTLIMALETLATGVDRPPLVLDLLEKWRNETGRILQTLAPDSDDAASLHGISRELLFRRQDSIRQQIRSLVLRTLAMSGEDDPAKQAVRLYDLRSTLVHGGTLPHQRLSESVTEAKDLVERILRAHFMLAAAGKLQGVFRLLVGAGRPRGALTKTTRDGAKLAKYRQKMVGAKL
ncbi:MAG: hypothetical protein ABI811_10935 [Acidobacteriota bacterium]